MKIPLGFILHDNSRLKKVFQKKGYYKLLIYELALERNVIAMFFKVSIEIENFRGRKVSSVYVRSILVLSKVHEMGITISFMYAEMGARLEPKD